MNIKEVQKMVLDLQKELKKLKKANVKQFTSIQKLKTFSK